ncbi:serine kinase [Jannaschia sp. S6380]|uniref:HPr kinase/phosphorylase n=1 Tax=Jannaschia sp. S6380 TaxID=2926408 RepID=UPI001FF198B1|nr:serine kinase [Jannaschia sp. S6380]MCK0169396.1 serine kinase [Jannaschia sp. S6380]
MRLTPMGDGRHCLHATAVTSGGRGLLILGASGAGKSGLAAELVALGGALISDDLVVLTDTGGRLVASRPTGAPPALELRGIGIVNTRDAGPHHLHAVLSLEPIAGRLPEPTNIVMAGHDLPLLRHPAAPGLAAKILLWLAAR